MEQANEPHVPGVLWSRDTDDGTAAGIEGAVIDSTPEDKKEEKEKHPNVEPERPKVEQEATVFNRAARFVGRKWNSLFRKEIAKQQLRSKPRSAVLTAIPEVDGFANGRVAWPIEGMAQEEIQQIAADSTRVTLMGPFKVGKSAIANRLLGPGVQAFDEDEVGHTKGETLVLSDYGGDTPILTVDLEGFWQPLDSNSPYIAQTFFIDHVRQLANVLVIVVERMHLYDVQLLQKIVSLFEMTNSISQMVVLHNLRTIEAEADLLQHIEQTRAFFDKQESKTEIKTYHSPFRFTQMLSPKPVQHFFIGNFEAMPKQVEAQLEALRGIIRHTPPSKVDFAKATCSAVRNALSKYYIGGDIEEKHVVMEGNAISVKGGPSLRPRQDLHRLTMNNVVGFEYYYSEVKQVEHKIGNEMVKFPETTVYLDCPGLDKSSVQIQIIDEHSLQVKGNKHRFAPDRCYQVLETINLPTNWSIFRAEFGKKTVENSVTSTEDGVINFRVLLNSDGSAKAC